MFFCRIYAKLEFIGPKSLVNKKNNRTMFKNVILFLINTPIDVFYLIKISSYLPRSQLESAWNDRFLTVSLIHDLSVVTSSRIIFQNKLEHRRKITCCDSLMYFDLSETAIAKPIL